MTFHIAICDDQEAIVLMLHKYILQITNKEGIDVHIDKYVNPKKLLENVKTDPLIYHLILLDIEMPQMNGIELGKKLREYNEYLFIIYITGYDKYSLDSYDVGAVDYLLKPVNEKRLKKLILTFYQLVIALQDKKDGFISFNDGGNYTKVYYKDILYFEKYSNKVRVICEDMEYNPYMTFKELKEMIDEDMFIECNRGNIVNKEKITGFEHNDTLIINKRYKIPVSVSHRKEIKEMFVKCSVSTKRIDSFS